jgi:hypothetical protein
MAQTCDHHEPEEARKAEKTASSEFSNLAIRMPDTLILR